MPTLEAVERQIRENSLFFSLLPGNSPRWRPVSQDCVHHHFEKSFLKSFVFLASIPVPCFRVGDFVQNLFANGNPIAAQSSSSNSDMTSPDAPPSAPAATPLPKRTVPEGVGCAVRHSLGAGAPALR